MAVISREEEDEAVVTTAPSFSRVLKAAITLDYINIMARPKAGETGRYICCSEITKELLANRNPDASPIIDRLLFALACHGLLSCSIKKLKAADKFERLDKLPPTEKYFVDNEDGLLNLRMCS